jgi:four helix bundle protein
MKYSSFQELPVWHDAVRLAAEVFRLTQHAVFHGKGDLANQLQCAALSISNNIAEGFERQTVRELLQFIHFAKGSAGECLSMCAVMRELGFLNAHVAEIGRMETLLQGIGRQLGAWAASQRDSDIDGARYLDSRERERKNREARAQAFMTDLKRQQEERLRRLNEERRGRGGIADSGKKPADSGQGDTG